MPIVNEDAVYAIVRQFLHTTGQLAAEPKPLDTPTVSADTPLMLAAGVANRHIHLCRRDLNQLFGEGYELNEFKPLSQQGMFAARETVIVGGPKGALIGVRILGPLRNATQMEMSFSDARKLGVVPPIMQSGDTGNTPEVTIIGPKGSVVNHSSVMVAWRHVHMETDKAAVWGLKDGDVVRAKVGGDRAVIFENVIVRTGKGWVNEFHVDTDEANSANLRTGDMVEIIRAASE